MKQERIQALAFAMLWCGMSLHAQNTPALDQAYAGGSTVSGKASPGQIPVTIYDVSPTVRLFLGTSQSMDSTGRFAAVLNSRLVLGHRIVVVDRTGAISPAMTILNRPPSPARP